MSLNDPHWDSFYQQASLQNIIDPALVTAIARSETGDNLAHNGLFTLGIDVRGAGGSGGSNLTVGNATHTFYAYSSGKQAAEGLAGFLQANSRYGSDVSSLFTNPAALLQRMQDNGYSGCPGPECDPIWNNKIMDIRSHITGVLGPGGSGGGAGVVLPPGTGTAPGGSAGPPIGGTGPGSGSSGGSITNALSGPIVVVAGIFLLGIGALVWKAPDIFKVGGPKVDVQMGPKIGLGK